MGESITVSVVARPPPDPVFHFIFSRRHSAPTTRAMNRSWLPQPRENDERSAVGVIEGRRSLAAARGESVRRSLIPGSAGETGQAWNQPIAGHAGKWEWVLCVCVCVCM